MKTNSHPFRSLANKDLLEARDAYHVHLASLENVVGTAIGLYRIRKDDADAKAPTEESVKPGGQKKPKSHKPRTLANTVVKPWSWPCVLVFVREWKPPSAFAKSPDSYIPPRLYPPMAGSCPPASCRLITATWSTSTSQPPRRRTFRPVGLHPDRPQ